MSFLIYTNMLKRGDGRLYADMHKTDGVVYFTPEEAQAAIDADPELARYRHVVPIECDIEGTAPRLRDLLDEALDSLEYVQRLGLGVSGWGVRAERIERIQAALYPKGAPNGN